MSNNLVLFSGGADSTFLTYKLLTETQDDVTLAIICSSDGSVANGFNRRKIIKVHNIVKELRKVRDLEVVYKLAKKEDIAEFSEDNWYNFGVREFKSDFISGKYDRFVTGCGYEQNDGAFMKNSSTRGVRPYFDAKKKFEDEVGVGQFWAPLVTHDFYQNYNRWHLKFMPENLRDISLSCIADNNCGVCGKCLYDSKVRQCIADGWTAEDLNEWRQERSRFYGRTRDATILYWIHVEMGVPRELPKGVAYEDSTGSVLVNSRESFDEWFDTIEYLPPTDWALKRWGLDKTGWSPPSV